MGTGDRYLLERLRRPRGGTPGEIDFDDPDVIVAVETIGQHAGLSRWTRADLCRHALLRLD